MTAGERAVSRLTEILEESYDLEDDPATPIQDLLTDCLHVLAFSIAQHPDRDDLDISDLLHRARIMYDDEVLYP